MTVYEKYQLLARDASASGDRIAGENYLQHAEHYYRLMEAAKQNAQQQQQANGQDRQPDQRPRRNQSEQQPENNPNVAAGESASPNGEAAETAVADDGAATADNAEQPQPRDEAPMSPAALAAEVEAMSESNGSAEAAPKQSRRRRRPPQNAAPEADAQKDSDPDDSEAVNA